MPVKTHWHNADKNIIVYTMSDPWTWEEMNAEMDALRPEYDVLNHAIVVIIDVRESKNVPVGAIAKGRDILKKRHPNVQRSQVFCGSNAIFRSVINLFSRLVGKYFGFQAVFVVDMEEAVQQAEILLQSG